MSKYIKVDELAQALQTGKAVPQYTLEELNTQNIEVNLGDEPKKEQETKNTEAQPNEKDKSLVDIFLDFAKKLPKQKGTTIRMVYKGEIAQVIATDADYAQQKIVSDFKREYTIKFGHTPSTPIIKAVEALATQTHLQEAKDYKEKGYTDVIVVDVTFGSACKCPQCSATANGQSLKSNIQA